MDNIKTVIIRRLLGDRGWLILVQHRGEAGKWYWHVSLNSEFPNQELIEYCYAYGWKESEFQKVENSFVRVLKKVKTCNQRLAPFVPAAL